MFHWSTVCFCLSAINASTETEREGLASTMRVVTSENILDLGLRDKLTTTMQL